MGAAARGQYRAVQYEEVSTQYATCLEPYEVVLGVSNSDTAETICNVADYYESRAELKYAESLYSRALKLLKSCSPSQPRFPIVLSMIQDGYGSILQAQGRTYELNQFRDEISQLKARCNRSLSDEGERC